MKTFKVYTTEMARRNPDQNPKISAYDQIVAKKYNGKDIFFSYTGVLKVGVNPRSKHNTPNGIYTFPAREIVGMVRGDMANAPYVGGQPYIHVLQVNPKGVVDPLESYTKSDFYRDMKKIYKLIDKHKTLPLNSEGKKYIEDIIENAIVQAKTNTPIAWFWNATRELTNDDLFLGFMGWGGVKAGEVKSWYADRDNFEIDMWGRRKRIPKNERKGNKSTHQGVSKNAQGWNNLLRALGYNGFVDRSGSSIIHGNEPMQAVFLSKKAFKVIDVIENKSYQRVKDNKNLDHYIKILNEKGNKFSTKSQLTKHEMSLIKLLADSDLKGCDIDYDNEIYVTGGVIKDCDINTEYIIFDKVTIKGGNFVNIRDISRCKILGGNFDVCTFDECEHLEGYYERCKFTDETHFSNCYIYNPRLMYTGSVFQDCRVSNADLQDCDFTGFSTIENTVVSGKSKDVVLYSDGCRFTRCQIRHAKIMAGEFNKTKVDFCTIKGGTFNEGIVRLCDIHDGEFNNVEMKDNTDIG